MRVQCLNHRDEVDRLTLDLDSRQNFPKISTLVYEKYISTVYKTVRRFGRLCLLKCVHLERDSRIMVSITICMLLLAFDILLTTRVNTELQGTSMGV